MFDLKFLQNYDPGNASNVVSSDSTIVAKVYTVS